MRIILCDDDISFVHAFEKQLRSVLEARGSAPEIILTHTGMDALREITQSPADVLFLDIEMPELGGMDAAERIRTVDPDVVLVFVTNMAQYAIRGYEVDALDFVLKPVNYYQFSTKLARALQRVQRRKGGQIALQTAGGVQLLNTEDIYWLETRDRMLHYHTSTGVWSVRSSLQNAEKQLAPYHFAKCNQCYLVNLRYVRAVQNDMVQVGEDRLEISRRQRAAFLAAVAAYVGGAM